MTVVGGSSHRRCGEAAAGGVVMEDVACHGCVGVVAEPPVHDVAVDRAGLNVV